MDADSIFLELTARSADGEAIKQPEQMISRAKWIAGDEQTRDAVFEMFGHFGVSAVNRLVGSDDDLCRA